MMAARVSRVSQGGAGGR